MSWEMIRSLSLGLLVFLALAAPAAARAPVVGIGDQHPHMFSDPDFLRLGVSHSRLLLLVGLVPRPGHGRPDRRVDGGRARGRREAADRLQPQLAPRRRAPAAVADAVQEELPPGPRPLPRRARVLRLERGQPHAAADGAQARAAAQYFNAMRRGCRSCRIVAADVLDSRDMLGWIKTFKRYAPKARIWGLHNYKDANDATDTTKTLLKAVRGQVWLTETGGILRLKPQPGSRGDGRRSTQAKQAAAVKRVYKIAAASRRITRIYFYEWQAQPKNRWDSAFLNADGTLRPAYHALKRGLRR